MGLFRRKSVAQIVGPLRKIREQLEGAREHHLQQVDHHSAQKTHHGAQADDAAAFIAALPFAQSLVN